MSELSNYSAWFERDIQHDQRELRKVLFREAGACVFP